MSDKSTTRCSAADLRVRQWQKQPAVRPGTAVGDVTTRTLAASQRAYKTAQSNRKWPIMVFPRNHKFRINKKKKIPSCVYHLRIQRDPAFKESFMLTSPAALVWSQVSNWQCVCANVCVCVCVDACRQLQNIIGFYFLKIRMLMVAQFVNIFLASTEDKGSSQSSQTSIKDSAVSRLNHPTPQRSVQCTLIISFALRLVH